MGKRDCDNDALNPMHLEVRHQSRVIAGFQLENERLREMIRCGCKDGFLYDCEHIRMHKENTKMRGAIEHLMVVVRSKPIGEMGKLPLDLSLAIGDCRRAVEGNEWDSASAGSAEHKP